MFGTLYLPEKDETFRLGLEIEREESNPHVRIRDFYLEPFRHAWKTLKTEGFRCLVPRNRIVPGYVEGSYRVLAAEGGIE